MDFDDKQHSLVTFRVGSILCCAPCLYVKSIITPPAKFTKPPGSNKTNPGIFKHGAHIVKVIDLRQKFCVAEVSEKGSLIIIVFNAESFAFWVDQIIDVFDFPAKGWSGLPAGIPKDAFIRTLVLNEKIHLYTEFEKLITIGELSYFKNTFQQKKETKNEVPVVKEEIKKVTDERNNKISPSMNKQQTSTTDLPKENLKTNTAIETPKKTTPQVKKHIENSIKQQNSLSERKNNISIKPAASIAIKKEQQKIEDKKIYNKRTVIPAVEKAVLAEEESSNHILKIIFVMLILLAVIALYYFYSADSELKVKQKNKAVTLELIENPEIYDEPLDDPTEITPPLAPPLKEESKTEEVVRDNIVPHTIKPKEETTAEIIPQHVEIKKEEKKVVIKVYTPQAVKKKTKPLIVHSVIKGDTLWAITKKYINDPFRYPELAALNKIKNPHRIYPGDQVQIRFIQK